MAALHAPVELVAARAQKTLPRADARRPVRYEPKYDGWRGLLFTGDGVLQSRRGTNLAARFPELVRAGRTLGDVVLDGEIVALRDGRLDFGALTSAPRRRAGAGVTIYFVAFDLLAEGEHDFRAATCQDRRVRLEVVMTGARPPVQLAPYTTDRDQALTWMRPEVSAVGIEGCVIKRLDRPYRPGRSGDWIKVRHTVVVDAVVIGVTGTPNSPAELLLALPDATGELRRIGLSHPLPTTLRAQARPHLYLTGEPPVRVSTGQFGGRGETEYKPVHPTLVVEVEAEGSVLAFASRLRPTVHRLRPDLTLADLQPER
jgi:ATP-dependent DNA ligase